MFCLIGWFGSYCTPLHLLTEWNHHSPPHNVCMYVYYVVCCSMEWCCASAKNSTTLPYMVKSPLGLRNKWILTTILFLHNLLDCATSAKYTIFMLHVVVWFLYYSPNCLTVTALRSFTLPIHCLDSGSTNSAVTSPSGHALYGFWWLVCLLSKCAMQCVDGPPHTESVGHTCYVWVAGATCWANVCYHCWLSLSLIPFTPYDFRMMCYVCGNARRSVG